MADLTKFLSLSGLQRYDSKIKAFIADKVAGHLLFQLAEKLEDITEPKNNVIYLVPNKGETQNIKDEFMWIDGKWELIGTTAVDLTPYLKKTEADAKFETIVSADAVRLRVTSLENEVDRLGAIDHDAYIAADSTLKTEITTAYEAADAGVKNWAVGEFSKIGHKHEIADVNGLQDALDAKADKSVVEAMYTNDQIDGFLADKADKSVVEAMYTNDQIDGFLADKADKSVVEAMYTNDQIDGFLADKADKSVVEAMYTNDQIDGFLADKADKSVVEAMYTNDQIDGFLADKADADSVYTKDEVDGKIDGINQSASALEGRVTTAEGNITALQTGKADKATTYTKDEVDASIQTLADELHAHMNAIVTDAEIDALFTATV